MDSKYSGKREVHFVDAKLAASFERLGNGTFEEKNLFLMLNKAFDDLIQDPRRYIKIQRNRWPKDYVRKYGVDNLWKYDLPNGWRLLYTIKKDSEIDIISVLLEWFSHKNYEKRFNY